MTQENVMTQEYMMTQDLSPVERFLMFIENTGHKAKDLFIALTSAGLQAKVKEINDLAEHAPCAIDELRW